MRKIIAYSTLSLLSIVLIGTLFYIDDSNYLESSVLFRNHEILLGGAGD